jgi:quinol monooxygenase YgiN
MAIGVLFQGGNVNQDRYQQVLDQVAPGNQPAPGMLYHAAGMGESGMVVFEVWESQEAAQRFFDEKLGQALQEANITVQPTFLQIVNTMQP